MGIQDRQQKSRAGKKGGKIGGVNRAKKLNPLERAKIAKQGGDARKKKYGS